MSFTQEQLRIEAGVEEKVEKLRTFPLASEGRVGIWDSGFSHGVRFGFRIGGSGPEFGVWVLG